MMVSILLMIMPIIDNPKVEYMYAILFIIGGAMTYIPFVRYNVEVPFLGKFDICNPVHLPLSIDFIFLLAAGPNRIDTFY